MPSWQAQMKGDGFSDEEIAAESRRRGGGAAPAPKPEPSAPPPVDPLAATKADMAYKRPGSPTPENNETDTKIADKVAQARSASSGLTFGMAPKLEAAARAAYQSVKSGSLGTLRQNYEQEKAKVRPLYSEAAKTHGGTELATALAMPTPGSGGVNAASGTRGIITRVLANAGMGAATGAASAWGADQDVGGGAAIGAGVGGLTSAGSDALSKAIGSPQVRKWAFRALGAAPGLYAGKQVGEATGSPGMGAGIGAMLGMAGGQALAKKLTWNPEVLMKVHSLQRWLPTLAQAAIKGNSYLTAHLHAIQQRDPEVRQELREAMEQAPKPPVTQPAADTPSGGARGY